VMVALSSEVTPQALGIELRQTKNNHAPTAPSRMWALEFDDFGLAGVRRASPGEFDELDARKKKKPKERVYDLLAAGTPMTATDLSKELGLDYSFVADICRRGLNAAELGCTQDGRNKRYHLMTKREDVGVLQDPPTLIEEANLPSAELGPLNQPAPGWENCSVCHTYVHPASYTSDGRPLCYTCATEN
jgi:hypothetical protein